ncbi:MAG: hypothetical protein KDD01_10680 [Phaeodactylibacter sp.]|nr:hypothetical protein [Phaeodactylibacter sp.]
MTLEEIGKTVDTILKRINVAGSVSAILSLIVLILFGHFISNYKSVYEERIKNYEIRIDQWKEDLNAIQLENNDLEDVNLALQESLNECRQNGRGQPGSARVPKPQSPNLRKNDNTLIINGKWSYFQSFQPGREVLWAFFKKGSNYYLQPDSRISLNGNYFSKSLDLKNDNFQAVAIAIADSSADTELKKLLKSNYFGGKSAGQLPPGTKIAYEAAIP